MVNKKGVSAFWWVLIILFAVIIFMGAYVLFTGTYINDFWRYASQNRDSLPLTDQNRIFQSSTQTESTNNNVTNTSTSGTWRSFSSNVNPIGGLDSLPAPPSLPS